MRGALRAGAKVVVDELGKQGIRISSDQPAAGTEGAATPSN